MLAGFASPTSRPSVVDSLKRAGTFQDSPTSDTDNVSTSDDIEAGNSRKKANPKQTSPVLLGTINGVFLPCLQNILGVILFLRLPFITAQAGVYQTSAIILICVASTFLTSLSLSAIATNGQIQSGGPYYVISRTLGKECGASIGVLFYLGTTIAASMYVLGAIEAIQTGFNLQDLFTFDAQTLALVLMLIIATTVAVGVKYVNRGAVVFLGIVLVSIFCLSLGAILFAAGTYRGELTSSARRFGDNMMPQYSPDPDTGKTPSFLSLLALFYPSVTGIMAGSNRSAVLQDPSRSIPKGTLSAVAVTTAIYLTVVWIFGSVLSNEALLNNKLIVTAVAWPAGIVVRIGIIMSSVGAALQCMAGAPRLLSAIAADQCIGFLRHIQPASESANPTRAVFCTWVIASLVCLAGNLDAITPLITMCFLLMYGCINLSCFLLGILRAPSFRPTFHYFHWSISLLGFIWCVGLAFTINYLVALGAIALTLLLFGFVLKSSNKAGKGDLGDIIQGIRYTLCHGLLKEMAHVDQVHAKNWRPLVLTIIQADTHGVISSSENCLIRLCSQLSKGRGMNTVVAVMPGSILDPESKEAAKHIKLELQRQYSIEGLSAFPPEVAMSSPTFAGSSDTVSLLAGHSGVGPLRPNTVLLSWPHDILSDEGRGRDLITSLQHLTEEKRTILLLRGGQSLPGDMDRVKHETTIDIWWLCHDGGLLLLLPFLLSRNAIWKGARLRLFAGVTSIVRDLDRFRDAILEHLQKARIVAEVEVVDLSHLKGTFAIDAPTVSAGADDDAVAGTLLYQILSPEKDLRPMPSKDQDMMLASRMENSLSDRNSSTTDHPSPRQRLVFDAVANDNGDNNDDASQGFDSVTENYAVLVAPHISNDDDDDDDDDDDTNSNRSMRMQNALALNQAIRSRSRDGTRLVVTNLPLLKPMATCSSEEGFIDYVEAMCRGIDNVLLVRGAGNEVITQYA